MKRRLEAVILLIYIRTVDLRESEDDGAARRGWRHHKTLTLILIPTPVLALTISLPSLSI